jgi:flagellar basal body P-ring protein FlgI
VSALVLLGAGPTKKNLLKDPPPLKVEETVGDLASIISTRGEIPIEGVGLVFGLDDTGADPPPSYYKQRLVDEMRKAGVERAVNILKDKRFSLVIVRAKIPNGATPSDRLDVELELPPASGTTSLAGGYLLQTRLHELMVAGGTPKEGSELGFAQGPVMIGTATDPNNPKVGRVLGGARIKKAQPFRISIKDSHRSIKASKLLETVINSRFHFAEGVNDAGAATSKTDQFLELKVPHVYHHNQDRFFRVVKTLSIVDSQALRTDRMEEWGRELLDPTTAGVAALRLEGMGPPAVEALKKGLDGPNPQARFLAAEALAYLNDASGADVLVDTATNRREFRAYALAALGAIDQSASHMALRKLMDVPDVEVRYGAFNSLRTLDESDPFLGRVRVLDDPEEPDEDPSNGSLAMALSTTRRRRNRQEDPFALYLVDSEGPPMVHVARTRRCEIVVFGRDQQLLTPVVLGNGPILLNAADGDAGIEISKIVPARAGEVDSDTKKAASLALGDVIRQTANLGAKYPDIVAILQAAQRQKNLPGPLVVDAVPGPSPVYVDAAIFGKDTTAKKDAALKKTKLDDDDKPKGFMDRVRGLFRR